MDYIKEFLKDMSSGKNIIWASDTFSAISERDAENKIKPRNEKSKEEQLKRVRNNAEVFTPSWICNRQNNVIDENWFGRKEVFNSEKEKSWETRGENILFSDEEGKSWKDYIIAKRLEISCGEAPYITSRYDAVSGEYIVVKDRIGFLDRKLRVVGEQTAEKADWLFWAKKAVQSVYGYDWQGDNVLIARKNVLFTVAEHYTERWGESLSEEEAAEFANIIVWNIWQMDGLKCVVPLSCCEKEIVEEDLFERKIIAKACEGCLKGNNTEHNGIYCVIMDWEENKKVRFVDLVLGERGKAQK